MTALTTSSLLAALRDTSLDDVWVSGFVDKEVEPLQFHASYRTLFFACGGIVLKAAVIRDEGQLELSIVDRPTTDHRPDEDDLIPALSSVREVALVDPNGVNSIAAVHLWNVRETASAVLSAALRFDLSNGQRLFIDPSYFFGMRLGGAEQEQAWQDGFRKADWEHIEHRLQS
jgi:hypothetical protein